jgi:Carboxypeptidase regulatory-like domain/TonB dependent receptor/TonB-dependent Receptor Plug Domain
MRTPVLGNFPRIKFFAVTLVLALLVVPSIVAQTQITTGTIQGTVEDEKGAVVPGATVEVKNLDTNSVRTMQTDESGRFTALALQPGNYSVTVLKQGFATTVLEKTALTVGQALTIPFSLKISSVEERVTITATPTVDTVKTEVSTTLNETAVSTTPILGRKFEDLLTLTPGVSITQGPDGDEINFSGQRGIFNNVSLDGGDYNNGFFGEQLGGQRAAIDITLEAVKEFQVVATGASAEFGRTAGGVINVITKSGTNDIHGSAFYFQRFEGLTANTSDGKPLTGFHREQYGATVGGPFKKDRAFYFLAFEGIRESLERANLSEQIGDTACPVGTPTILANEALINGNADCQRLALINFMRTTRNQEEGLPILHKINNQAFFSRVDFDINNANHLSVSYNFDHSKNTNQTFDVNTYGNSANGTEGPSKINVVRANLFTTISPTKLNEAHFSYGRELRPRSATDSNIPADTAMGFATTFRFGNPFFLEPAVDELLWRTQIKDNFSIVTGNHTIKVGGEWLHTLNDQVFRGFFTGRYIFDSVTGFLRYASPEAPGGFGPRTVGCADGTFVTAPATCPGGLTNGGPLLLYLQGAGLTGPATDAAGFSKISNEDIAVFAQDSWKVWPNFTLNYGLRYEAQLFPDPVVAPSQTAYGIFLNDPRFPSDGTLPNQTNQWQPRLGFAWDISKVGKSVLRASAGIYYARQNMLSQVGSITTNGVQQQTIFRNTELNTFLPAPVWPNVVAPPSTVDPCVSGSVSNPFPCGSGVRVFSRDYKNPRIYTVNVGFEQEIATDWSLYLDYTHSKAVHLTRFLNINRNNFFAPFLGEVMVTSAVGKSAYDGFTAGMRKRFSRRYQLEWNYTLAKDKDDDSNERDPFTDRSFDINNLQLDYALSDRDIRHKFNFFTFIQMGWGFDGNFRVQGRTAQPITPGGVRTATNRNSARKDNQYFSFDWRIQRPIQLNERFSIIPIIEMFNTFNNANNINPLVTPGLFNFDGFLRQGVGDPRQVQLAVKLTF